MTKGYHWTYLWEKDISLLYGCHNSPGGIQDWPKWLWMIWVGVWTFRSQVRPSVGGRAPTRLESMPLTNSSLCCEHGIMMSRRWIWSVNWRKDHHLWSFKPGSSQVSIIQLCLTLYDTMDCSPPGSSVHGILQARILEWVAMPSFRGSSKPRNQTHVC